MRRPAVPTWWSDRVGIEAVPHSLDVGLSLSDQGAPHGATFSVSHNVFWPPWGGIEVGLSLRCSTGVACPPLDDRAWWLEIWWPSYDSDPVTEPLVLHRGVPPTVYGCYAPIRDRGCHVDASGSGKCATARDRGCIYDSDLEKEALVLPWVYFLPVVDTVDLVETVGAMSALPLQARVGLTGAVGAMSTIGWVKMLSCGPIDLGQALTIWLAIAVIIRCLSCSCWSQPWPTSAHKVELDQGMV
ncbi:hypothetical protein V6N12_048991 [Hibiscus sabdariffa]|uniref:Uncharacterized protein n=1 Tax=Hibiscus sabdariffa TaxID=183260 RepID=A0ABR2EJ97_9ROSI